MNSLEFLEQTFDFMHPMESAVDIIRICQKEPDLIPIITEKYGDCFNYFDVMITENPNTFFDDYKPIRNNNNDEWQDL